VAQGGGGAVHVLGGELNHDESSARHYLVLADAKVFDPFASHSGIAPIFGIDDRLGVSLTSQNKQEESGDWSHMGSITSV